MWCCHTSPQWIPFSPRFFLVSGYVGQMAQLAPRAAASEGSATIPPASETERVAVAYPDLTGVTGREPGGDPGRPSRKWIEPAGEKRLSRDPRQGFAALVRET